MEDIIILLFICLAVPLFMSVFVFSGKERTLSIFLLLGLYTAIFAAYLNGFLTDLLKMDRLFATYTLTPAVEEILKAFPIILYGNLFRPTRKELLSCAMMLGIGFAMLENAYVMLGVDTNATVMWALIRGCGAGLMHATCSLFIGYGVSYIRTRKKLVIIGIYGLLLIAVLYHADYNLIAVAENHYLAIIVPVAVFGLILYLKFRREKKKTAGISKKEAETE